MWAETRKFDFKEISKNGLKKKFKKIWKIIKFFFKYRIKLPDKVQ